MRVLALLMVLVTVIAVAFLSYCYAGMQMEIVAIGSAMTSAVDAEDRYDDIRQKLSDGSFYGKVYNKDVEFLMPESFAFLTLTVRMQNKGVFPMEWLRIEVTPDPSDIVQLPVDRTPSLAAGTTADFDTTLLTRTGATPNREVEVTYYVLGNKRQATFVMGAQ